MFFIEILFINNWFPKYDEISIISAGNMIRKKLMLNTYKERRHHKYLILMIVFLVQINRSEV